MEICSMISMIVPCFNAEDYLYECFESIKGQTYREFEVIFVNDGSTDGTLELLERIKENHPELQITIATQQNAGVSAARNRGIKLAQGDYLTFVDADDSLSPEFLDTLWQGREKGELSVVGIGGQGYGKPSRPFRGVITKERFVHEFWLTRHLWGSTCNKLYARRLLLQHNILFHPDLKVMEDMLFNMVYCQYIDRIYVSNKLLYHYRYHEKSAMHRAFSATNMTIITTFQHLLALPLSESDKKIIELHQVNSLMWLLRILYKDGTREELEQYEDRIVRELARSNQALFLTQGWKKGLARYLSFLLYRINPTCYKRMIKRAYKLKEMTRRIGSNH